MHEYHRRLSACQDGAAVLEQVFLYLLDALRTIVRRSCLFKILSLSVRVVPVWRGSLGLLMLSFQGEAQTVSP